MVELTAGDLFGSYVLEGEIGLGGAARLFRARHVNPASGEHLFALKVLKGNRASDPDFVSNFRREGYLLSTLKHANIVDTYEAGLQGGNLFIAMEYVHGRDFGDVLDHHRGPLPQIVALYVVQEVLHALDYAHNLLDRDGAPRGVSHRDVKPSNVLISYDGRVKLTDFGIASSLYGATTQADDRLLGTKGYFAPEQLDGAPVDHRADIFGVGVVLYEALCGRLPFDADRTTKLLKQNRQARMPRPRKVNPGLAPDLEAIVLRALERRPDNRYGSCREMLADLRSFGPHRTEMPLALGSLVRALFATEADVTRGPWGRSGPGSIPPSATVAACVNDATTREFLIEHISSPLGVSVVFCSSAAELARGIESGARPRAIITDIDDPYFNAAEFISVQGVSARPLPVLSICNAIEARSIALADTIGTTDLLVRPLSDPVTTGAVRRALRQTMSRVESDISKQAPQKTLGVRLLVVSQDRQLCERIAREFMPWGYLVDEVATPKEALSQFKRTTYLVVIYDLTPVDAIDPILPSRIRSLPGVGLMPFLFLHDPGAPEPALPLPERAASRPRTASSVVLAAAVNHLRSMTHLGRTFKRLPMEGKADLTYRGLSVSTDLANISRGGVLLRTGKFPAVGTPCTVTFDGCSLEGQVIRLDFNEDKPDEPAGVAIAFNPNSAEAEFRLINLIGVESISKAPLLTPPPGYLSFNLNES